MPGTPSVVKHMIKVTGLERFLILKVPSALVVILSVCMLGSIEATATPFESYSDVPVGTESAATELPQRSPTPRLLNLTFWNDQLMFETSFPTLTHEDFSGTNVGPGSFSSCAGPFNSATNNSCFSPGAIVGGISVDNQEGGPNVVVTPGYFPGIVDFLVGPSDFSHDAVIFLDPGVEAFGANMYNPFGVIPLAIEVFGAGGSLGSTNATGSPNGEFFGVSSDGDAITRIEVAAGGQGGEVFANMQFGNARGGWVEQTVPPGGGFRQVHAVDENIVWAAGAGGRMVLTVDGGVTWEDRLTGFPGLDIFALFAFDDRTVVAAADVVGGPHIGTILRTSDGGLSWSAVDTAGSFINGIHFFNEQDGWLVADPVGGVFNLQESTDGGQTWFPSPNPPVAPPGTAGLADSYGWADTQRGIFGCHTGDEPCLTIFQTEDGGVTWNERSTNIFFPDVALSDNGVGLAGENALPGFALDQSTDFGQSWDGITSPDQLMCCFDFVDGTDEVWGLSTDTDPVFAFSWIHSTNGGLDWTLTRTGDFIPFDLDFVCGSGPSVGWSVGALFAPPFNGRIFKLSSGPPCPTTSVEMTSVQDPRRLALRANRPNPFNPSTVVDFDVSEAGRVNLRIYDGQGRLVRTLKDGLLNAGAHSVEWDGRDGVGLPVVSGVYLVRLEFGGETLSRKVVLTK